MDVAVYASLYSRTTSGIESSGDRDGEIGIGVAVEVYDEKYNGVGRVHRCKSFYVNLLLYDGGTDNETYSSKDAI